MAATGVHNIKPGPAWRNAFQRFLNNIIHTVLYDGNNPPQLDENRIIGFVSPSHTYSGSVTGPVSQRLQ